MTTTFAENALKEFHIALDDLDANLQFIRAAGRLRPRLNNMLNWLTLDEDAKTLVQHYIDQKSTELSLLYRGMVIVLAGAFEQLIRRLIHDAVVNINHSAKNYDALAEAIKVQNTHLTGRALSTITEPLDHLVLDYHILCKNIATCVPGQEKFSLNAEAFGVFISSVSPRNLVDIFRKVGVELRWDDFGRNQNLRGILNKKDTRETAKAIQDFLGKFIQMRNKIAHTGSGGITVTDTEIEQFLQFFRIFCVCLAQVVHDKLPKSSTGRR